MRRTPLLLALLLLSSCYTSEAIQKLPTDFWINLEGLLYALWQDVSSAVMILL